MKCLKTIFLYLLSLVIIVLAFCGDITIMYLIYPMWIMVALHKGYFKKITDRFPLPWAFILSGTVFGLLTECFAVISNLNTPYGQRILMHQDPIIDLIFGLVYYALFISTLYLIVKKINYSKKGLFFLFGGFGIISEEIGQVLIRAILQFPMGTLYAVSVMFVYGIFPLLAYILTEERFPQERKPVTIKYILFSFLILLFVWAILYGNVIHPAMLAVFPQ